MRNACMRAVQHQSYGHFLYFHRLFVTRYLANPMKTMRLIRVLGNEGQSMCSLILADPSEAAIEWFHGMHEKYGDAIELD